MLHIPTHGTYDMCQRYCIMATPSLVYLFKRVKHGTQNIQNDCHQWLSGTFTVGTCESFFFVRIESRIESAVRFVFESIGRLYHASRNRAWRTAGVPYSSGV